MTSAKEQLIQEIELLLKQAELTDKFYRFNGTLAGNSDGFFVMLTHKGLINLRQTLINREIQRKEEQLFEEQENEKQQLLEADASWSNKILKYIPEQPIVMPINPELILQKKQKEHKSRTRTKLHGSERSNWRDPSPSSSFTESLETEAEEKLGYISDQFVSDSDEFGIGSEGYESGENFNEELS